MENQTRISGLHIGIKTQKCKSQSEQQQASTNGKLLEIQNCPRMSPGTRFPCIPNKSVQGQIQKMQLEPHRCNMRLCLQEGLNWKSDPNYCYTQGKTLKTFCGHRLSALEDFKTRCARAQVRGRHPPEFKVLVRRSLRKFSDLCPAIMTKA